MGQNLSANNSSNDNSPVHRSSRSQSQQHNQPPAPHRNSPSTRRVPDCVAGGSGGDLLLMDAVDAIGHELRKQANQLTELSTFSFEDFRHSLNELNALSRRCQDAVGGKRLVFVARNGTDQTVLWKATVRIGCVKVDSRTNRIESHQMMNLAQYLRVYRTFQAHGRALESSQLAETERINDLINGELRSMDEDATTTVADSSDAAGALRLECVICMDRTAEVSLPCAHYYCFPCIEQWRAMNKTCPVCQDKLSDADDSWVLAETPAVDEVSDRICSDLMTLSSQQQRT